MGAVPPRLLTMRLQWCKPSAALSAVWPLVWWCGSWCDDAALGGVSLGGVSFGGKALGGVALGGVALGTVVQLSEERQRDPQRFGSLRRCCSWSGDAALGSVVTRGRVPSAVGLSAAACS